MTAAASSTLERIETLRGELSTLLLALGAPAEAAESVAQGDDVGARLVALELALNGTPREQADAVLAEQFRLGDGRRELLDDVYAAAGRRSRPRALRPPRALPCARAEDRPTVRSAGARGPPPALARARRDRRCSRRCCASRRCGRRASGSTRPRRGTSCAGRSARCCRGSPTARATRRCSTCWSGAGRASSATARPACARCRRSPGC